MMIVTRPRLIASLLCLLLLLVAAILFALSRAGPQLARPADPIRTFDVQAEPPPSAMVAPAPPAVDAPPEASVEPGAAPQSAPIAVTMPRIAYSYGFSFRLDRERIAAVQERHLAACRRLGPSLCRVTAMQRGGTNDGDAGANLKLQIAAGLADGFGRTLAAIAGESGGETLDRSIRAEDLSRQMIDSDARIRTRELLIQRLTALLQTRSGNIEQAVEAERAINGAQEELEAARAELADMRGRVAMSAVEISYVARGPAPDSPNPIVQAFDQVASVSTSSVGAMIMIVGIALPWALLGALVFLAVRTVRRRRDSADAEPEAEISGARPAP